MDGSRFDQLARALGAMRTRRTAVAVVGGALAAPVLAGSQASGKPRKRRKKCAKKCADGCCASKYGKCIKPGQQSITQCGTGGGICQNPCRCSATLPCPTGLCCTGAGTCGACTVFVTSTKGTGNIGGLAGADAECQDRAEAAGLSGTYLAWLSTSTVSPASRFTKATGPYALPGGEVVANSWADLTSGNPLRHLIDQFETGEEITGTNQGAFRVWTNTLRNGGAGGSDPNGICQNWTTGSGAPTGNMGEVKQPPLWTEGGFQQCSVESRLYCFQQR